MSDNLNISIDQIQVGLYIHLDLKWFEHPFAFSHFKIKNEEQIKTLRSLGLTSVRFDPALSDVKPAPPGAEPQAETPAQGEAAAAAPESPAESPALAAKRATIERIRTQRDMAARIEHAFADTAKTIRDIEKNLLSHPAETVSKASQLIGQIADSILCAPELAVHVMGDKLGGDEVYLHSMNVVILSMMMARDIKLPPEVISALGVGALFHDLGHKSIPERILMNMHPLTHAEQNLLETHCQAGLDIAQRLELPAAVQAIVRDHHEAFDGSGYPRRLKGEAISILCRIISIANYYDELCNPFNVALALTPHEALSMMFAKLRGKFDPKLLQVFIRCLGVYPPGTVVQLSNGVIGMVATVNTAKPTKPVLIIYDPDVPRHNAIIVDMDGETDLNIAKAIKPAQVPKDIYIYLSPRKRISYYFDAGKGQGTAAS